MRIGFIGIGKLGMPCAEAMAQGGHTVTGYDVAPRESDIITVVDTIKDCVQDKDIVFIAVPTPHDPEYDGRAPTAHLAPKDFNYDIVKAVMTEADKHMTRDQLLVLISTVLPGTTRREFIPLVTNTRFIYNPYLIAMGSVAWDMVNPEMVMIGTEDGSQTGDARQLVDFYRTIMQNDPRYEIGTWDECECIKVFYNCYSADTEVLTDNGWKNFSDAGHDDEVLALNPETMIPEWVKPNKWVSRLWDGEMIHFHSSKDDILVTPNHNMFMGKQTSYRSPQLDGNQWGYSWGLMAAEDVVKRSGFVFQRSTEWHNDSPNTIALAGIEIPTAIYVQFMAWYLSEGCCSSGRIIISQDRDVNADKYEMINEVFTVIHSLYPGNNKLCEGKAGMSLLWKELAQELSIYGKSFDKFIPETIKTLGTDMIRLFLDIYNLADGSAMGTTRFNGTVENDRRYKYYASSSDQMAADLGELIIKIGRFPSYRTTESELSNKPCHLIYELVGNTSNYQKSSSVGLKFDRINYSGQVYCAMLPKYHVFMTRRNGKCTWQGNTFISAKIGIVNMIQDVAQAQGNINVDVVTDALAKSNMRITGPQYMKAGMGDGGGCHPRDNIALRHMAEKLDLGYDMFDAIMNARDVQAKNIAKRLVSEAQLNGMQIVIHGKAYKPGVAYEDGSYSLLVGHFCEELGVIPMYADPLTGDHYNPIMPSVFLLAHDASTTYKYLGGDNPQPMYCAIPDGSIVVDPWRTYENADVTVIHYGNTRI
jgi:UDP-glucose 6-dehydrogenase